jgi:hypothetical protein
MNVGILYKSKLITIEDGGIRLLEGTNENLGNKSETENETGD